jgi:hypothetical protein
MDNFLMKAGLVFLTFCFISSFVVLCQKDIEKDPTTSGFSAAVVPDPAPIPQLQDPTGNRQTNSNSATPSPPTNFESNIDSHLEELKSKLPSGEFRVLLEPPFVVIGDQPLEQIKNSSNTVKWAVDRLKKDYFAKDPNAIIDIWLFKDEDSYYTNAENLFGARPTTMYGYYTPANKALVMNISTGGGTLVHEIVHPFIESNFPDCPSWFNEGLASLYEESGEREGKIIGLANWRLRALQLTIQDNKVPTFEKLCSTTRREFYDGDSTNYAQARYLCHYLQEKELLRQYYHAFVSNVAHDPTGFETLKRVLKRNDMVAFQREWESFVMTLKFPR